MKMSHGNSRGCGNESHIGGNSRFFYGQQKTLEDVDLQGF
jgi:hypothetical protein